MKAYRRIFAVLLALALVFPLLPGELDPPLAIKAEAAETISSSGDFYEILESESAATEGKTYEQTNNITLDANEYRKYSHALKVFRGHYDGGGYTITISGTFIKNESNGNPENYGGLFAETSAESVIENVNLDLKNLALISLKSTGPYYDARLGGIAGRVEGTVRNCSVSGELKVGTGIDGYAGYGYIYAGGICGMTAGSSAVIEGCYSSVNIQGSSTSAVQYEMYVGAIVGHTNTLATTRDCMVDGANVTAGGSFTIIINKDDEYNFVTPLNAALMAGGIAGCVGDVELKNIYVKDTNVYVTGGSIYRYCALFVGRVYGDTIIESKTSNIYGCNIQANRSTTGAHYYNFGGSSVENNSIFFTQVPHADNLNKDSDAWADTYTNDQSDTGASLKWRVSEAPKIDPGSSSLDGAPEIKLSSEKYPGSSIHYKLEYTKKGRAAAPTATIGTLGLSGYEITFTTGYTPDKSPVIYYKEQNETEYKQYAPPVLGTSNQTLQAFVRVGGTTAASTIYGVNDGIYTDSEITTVKIGSGGIAPGEITSGGEETKSTPQEKTHSSGDNIDLPLPVPPLLGTRTFAAPDFTKEVQPGSDMTLTAWVNDGVGKPGAVNTAKYTVANAVSVPVFSAKANDIIIDGIRITCVTPNATIYYTTDGSTPEANAQNTKVYTSAIPFTNDMSTMTIKAYATHAGMRDSQVATSPAYGDQNRPLVDPPLIRIGEYGEEYSDTTYYAPGTVIHFTHLNMGDGVVYYAINNNNPTTTYGKQYDPNNPPEIPSMSGSNPTFTLSAIFVRNGYRPSNVASFTFRVKTKHAIPAYNIPSGTVVKSGQELMLKLQDSNIATNMRPKFYLAEDDPNTEYTSEDKAFAAAEARGKGYYSVIEVHDDPDFTYSAPNIWYVMKQSDNPITETEALVYSQMVPEVRLYTTGSSDYTVKSPPSYAERIVLTGTAGSVVSISAQVEAEANTPFIDGTTLKLRYTMRNSAAAPTSWPATSEMEPTEISPTDMILLDSTTLGAKIYYTVDGTIPNPATVGQNGSGTMLYSGKVGHSAGSNEVLVVMAMAVADNMEDSAVVRFRYKTAALNTAAAPTVSPATSSSTQTVVQPGDLIILMSADNADIYYNLNGLPALDSSGNPTGGTLPYTDAGIMVPDNPGSVFTVRAKCVKTGIYDSSIATFMYKIADSPVVKAPIASPTTSANSITTLPEGRTVSLATETDGAEIYYGIGAPPTILYNSTSGITVTGSAGTFFTINTKAVKAGMADSPTVTFTYQLPAPVQAVWASPAEGKVVKGTEVTLSTTTSDATIFYEVAYGNQYPDDPVPNESPVFDSKKPIVIEKRTRIAAIAVKDNVSSIDTEYEYTVASQVTDPTPSISSGSIVAKGTIVTFSTTGGATVTYTKDGSDPTDSTNNKRMYGSEIAIDAEEGKSVSISLYATKTDMTPSEVVSVSYTVSKSDQVLTANPAANSTVKPGDKITLSTSVTGAEIYYTADGSDPTTNSDKGSTVTVDGAYGETFVIRAIAVVQGAATTPYIFSYNIIPRTPAPSASIPNGAVILEGATVSLTASEGSIYYTTDGSDPSSSSQLYTKPLELAGSTVLKAIAMAESKAASQVAEYIYTMAGQVAAPTASLPSGTIDVGSKIALSTTTEGATIYYTTNGTTPTVDNLRDCFICESPITISRPVSIRIFAVKDGMNASVVNTVTYTVAYPAEEEEAEADVLQTQWSTDRLFLFDQFVESGEGPLFEGIVLRDNLTLAVISAAEGALPEGVQLIVVRERSPSAEDEDAVTRALDMGLGALYSITLVGPGGETVQPLTSDGVEVGIPIPEDYEDTIVLICRINDNGTVTAFPTRRSAGMLYAVVDHFSKYAVAVPPLPQGKAPWFKTWYLWLIGVSIAAAGAAALTIVIIRKRKRLPNQ